MKNRENVVIFITTGTDEEAQEVAKAILNNRLAVCVNIVPNINSLFWWNGTIDSEQERLLIVKSKASVLNEIAALVKEIHSYEILEILALPIIGGNPDYLNWIGKEVFDLVICDLMMPKIHGFQILEWIRSNPDCVHTKIMVLTAKSYKADADKARRAGADLFISKPFEIADLQVKVEQLLS